MLYEVSGDLLMQDADIICHQTNFSGVMGAGVAASIRRKLLTDSLFREYETLCRQKGKTLLGTVQYLKIRKGYYVANLFCQNDWNTGPVLTNYNALRTCLFEVERFASAEKLRVALPGGMGCGIAGGDWNRVNAILHEVFDRSEVSCTVVFRKRQ